MKRKLPTILVLLVAVLLGTMYWVDICYYTDPRTGFVLTGTVWMRYIFLILPLIMGILGLRTVGPRAIAVLRIKNTGLAVLFILAAVTGALFGAARLIGLISEFNAYHIVLGVLVLVYAVWMFLCALQMVVQQSAAPTVNTLPGVLATLPFCVMAVYRVMVNPSSLYRLAPIVSALAAILAMLWLAMLLRSFYIALTRARARWMYLFGVFTFLFATCLEFPQTLYKFLFGGGTLTSLLEGICVAALGLVAGCVSVAISAQSDEVRGTGPPPDEKPEPAAPAGK